MTEERTGIAPHDCDDHLAEMDGYGWDCRLRSGERRMIEHGGENYPERAYGLVYARPGAA